MPLCALSQSHANIFIRYVYVYVLYILNVYMLKYVQYTYIYIANLHIMILYAKLCVMSLRVHNTHMGLLNYILLYVYTRWPCVFAYRYLSCRLARG